jgi:hypothetical protein
MGAPSSNNVSVSFGRAAFMASIATRQASVLMWP